MRVCYFGTYRAEYARNQILIEGLRRAGIEVVECHQKLWSSVEDRVNVASGGWRKPGFWIRMASAYTRLLLRYSRLGPFDILVVGYPGHYDIFLARLLAWTSRKPLVWDVLNSLYLITQERGIHVRSPGTGKLIRFLEKLACRLPDMMILDTRQFVEWFCQTHNLKPDRFRIVQIGADERFFVPQPAAEKKQIVFRVIYYGSYIPNHGVGTIVEAARMLAEDPNITFEMIGAGPDLPGARAAAEKYGLKNVQFIEWLERDALVQHIARADLVLGVFGTTRQNTLTNNNKIYEGFAMRKPVISASTPALPESLRHAQHLYLCERGDAASLADGIRTLKDDPELCRRLAKSGFQIFHEKFNLDQIGQQFARHLRELTGEGV